MKYSEAMAIIAGEKERTGYIVGFERKQGALLMSDHFPDIHAGEDPIEAEDAAWVLAYQFANKMRNEVVNVYVCHARDFTPVAGYRERILNAQKGTPCQSES